MANPTLLDMPIARDGNKNAIPTTDNGTTGLLSQQYGWQLINAIPPQQGGKAVKREDFNGVFNLLSNILFYAQKGWQWEFDETQSYFAGCTVKDTADGKTYVCIADVNASTTHPSADTTHWKLSDLATKSDLANYLPLAGGQMTGSIIRRDRDNSELLLYGGNADNTGGFLELFGSTASNANKFRLQAGSETSARLEGNPNGSLTWGGTRILGSTPGTYLAVKGGNGATIILHGRAESGKNGGYELIAENDAGCCRLEGHQDGYLHLMSSQYDYDLGSSAIVAKSLGATNGYIKFADGRIKQWKRIMVENIPSNTYASQEITYDISFPNDYPYIAQATVVNSGTTLSNKTYAFLDGVTNRTKCSVYFYNGASVAQDITVSLLFEGV